jgi:hypothetical protein
MQIRTVLHSKAGGIYALSIVANRRPFPITRLSKKKNHYSLSVIVSSGVFIHANLLSPACQIAGPPQTLLVCVVLDLLPLLPQVRQLMMMAKSETMALMMALIPAAMALTMAMMQFPMVRKTPWIYLCC